MATTFDKASLVMIPSGVKEDKLYSIKPTDGSGDFTFSRGSDIQATRVNSSGLIEKAKVNLLLQSQTFDNASWTKSNASVSANTITAPDGTSTADTFAITANFGTILQTPSLATGVASTYSVYVKNIDAAVFNLQVRTASTAALATFNFSGATLTSSTLTAGIAQGFTDEGNGWYRVYVSFVTTEVNQLCRLQIQDSGDSVYIWGAALCHGLIAQDYVETTTTAVVEGLTADLPRLDYSGGASCPSLLLEPSRTNVIPQAEYYNASQWTKTRCTISDNTDETLSPEGVYNASKMVSTDASESYAQDEGSISGTLATLSFFAKKGDTDFVHGTIWDNSANGCRQWFNVNTGVVGGDTNFGSGYSVVSGSENIESFGNGWYKCSFTANVTTGLNAFRMNLSSADETIGSPVNAYGYFYGVQAEAGSYPTSYIPTYGTAAVRGDDYSYTALSGNADFGIGDFSVFFDVENVDDDGSGATAIVGNRQSGEWWRFYGNKSQNRFHLEVSTSAGGYAATIIGTYNDFKDGRNKVVISRDSNRLICYVNGVEKINSTSAVYLQNFDGTNTRLELNAWNTGANAHTNVNFHQLLIFKGTALTASECQSLTTI
jgi:hypothetical protein